jgi:succinate dehydrogenase / fumarate reductase cytochrome b subunit
VSWLKKVLGSSIGLKLAVAVSGLGLVGFLIGHLYGNLQLFVGGTDGLDTYAEHLHALPGFTLIELGLLAMFVVHIPLVIMLGRANRSARPQRYGVTASKRSSGKLMGMASRMMPISGILLLIFLVVHVSDFRRERAEFHQADGSVFGLGIEVVEALSNPLLALIYVIGSLLAAWHVLHGFQSAFRSLGFFHSKYTPTLEKLSVVIALVLGLGFSSIPIAIQIGLVRNDAPAAEVSDDVAPEASAETH